MAKKNQKKGQRKAPKGAPAFIRNQGNARVRPLDGVHTKNGFTVETNDGRQAAVVRPNTVRLNQRIPR